jgi:hypothetical protein
MGLRLYSIVAETDLDPCTGQPAHQQRWMPEDAVLDHREGMVRQCSDVASSLLALSWMAATNMKDLF